MPERLSSTDQRLRRAEERRENRRADILGAALLSFATGGYHGTHVSTIIEAAGIARGTFYLYFDSKEAVFVELLERFTGELRSQVIGVSTGLADPPMELQLFESIKNLFRVVQSNRQMVHIVMREAVGLDPAIEQRLDTFYRELHDYVVSSLQEGYEKGLVRELDNDVVASCIVGSIKHVLERLVREEGVAVEPERLAAAVLDYNLRGLCP